MVFVSPMRAEERATARGPARNEREGERDSSLVVDTATRDERSWPRRAFRGCERGDVMVL